MPICTYQYYSGSGENAALGKCGPGGGSGILQENVASGRSRRDLGEGLGGVSGGFSCTKHIQSQEIIMPEASTKNGYGNRGQFCMK